MITDSREEYERNMCAHFISLVTSNLKPNVSDEDIDAMLDGLMEIWGVTSL